MSNNLQNNALFSQVVTLLQKAQQQVIRTVNQTMVYTYYEVGRMIVEEEQNGKDRAEYGKQLLKGLSTYLTNQFGKGFSVRNLELIKKFYFVYSKSQTASAILKFPTSEATSRNVTNEDSTTKIALNFQLTWSHYCFLISIDDPKERSFYEIESTKYSLCQVTQQL